MKSPRGLIRGAEEMVVPRRTERLRPWLALAGIILAVAVLGPPGRTAASPYVFAPAVQFAVLAIVVPALVVRGAPWGQGGAVLGKGGTGLADRVGVRRAPRPFP